MCPDAHAPAPAHAVEAVTSTRDCQRWTAGRQSWRPAGTARFDPGRYAVAPVSEPSAKTFVIDNHYAGTFPAAKFRYGLYDTDSEEPRLVGVAVYGIPVQAKVLTSAFPSLEPYRESLELSRFVLTDDVPGNGESWFLARCHTQLATAGVRGVVSFADPVPRRTAAGQVVAPGHVGYIYQASNALYTGRGTARTLTVLPDGTVLNDRAASKVRRGEQGHEYVEKRLVALGARAPRVGQDMGRWLRDALDAVRATRIRHPGNHRYLFRLGSTARARAAVPVGLPALSRYPKG